MPATNVNLRHVTIRKNGDGSCRHYFQRRGMPPIRLPDPRSPSFGEAYDQALAESNSALTRAQDGYRRQWADYLWKLAKRRQNRECDITRDEVLALFRNQNDRCALSGVRFNYRRENEARDPLAPSLDRIDSRAGYHKDNCRIVLLAVNIALNDWGDDVFVLVCRAVAKHRKTAAQAPIAFPAVFVKRIRADGAGR